MQYILCPMGASLKRKKDQIWTSLRQIANEKLRNNFNKNPDEWIERTPGSGDV